MKHAIQSNCKDPENHSKKDCCCGGHSSKAHKPKDKKHRADKPTHHMEVEQIKNPLNK